MLAAAVVLGREGFEAINAWHAAEFGAAYLDADGTS
jgi:hypothetical protein